MVNTKACRKLTKSSKSTTTKGSKAGVVKIAFAAATINHTNTIPASIFQNNLRDNDNILDSSETVSMIHINNHNIISQIFHKNVHTLFTLGTKPSHLYPKYFSTYLNQWTLNPYIMDAIIAIPAKVILKNISVDTGLK